MALIREAGGYSVPSKKKAPTPPPKPPSVKVAAKPKAPVAGNKKTTTAKAAFTQPTKLVTSKAAFTQPKTQAAKAAFTQPAAPSSTPTTGASNAGYVTGGSSAGGSGVAAGAPVGTPTTPTSGLGETVTAGPVGGATSQIAQMALNTLTGGGSAPGMTRRRNRAGAGYNLSLTPEQLRNIAARRVGG